MRFMDTMVAGSAVGSSALLDRLRNHLGADPQRLPVVTAELDRYEQPHVQVAVDDVLAPDGYHTERLSVAAGNKRWGALSARGNKPYGARPRGIVSGAVML